MRNRWVVNASPLILLAKADRIELLRDLSEQMVIPESVLKEVQQGPSTDPARQWLDRNGSSSIVADPTIPPTLTAWDLGRGETAVLAWAMQNPGFEAIVDDRAARKCALVNSIPCRGTLGVILAARKRNLIPAAKPICDLLIREGFLIDRDLLRSALRLIGE